MLQRSLGLLIMALVLPGAAEPASTCIFVPALAHRVDAALQRSDASAPAPPVVVAVDAFRRNGMTCTRQSCVANSCGDTGTVRIDLAPSADDATPPEELGYRLTLVHGELPASMSGAIGVTLAGGRPIYLRPTFEELPELHVELSAVAVDAAGNESEPSAPFSIDFDGCTLAAVGDRCEDDIDPEVDLSGVLDLDLEATDGELTEDALEEDGQSAVLSAPASAGCALARHVAAASSPGAGLALAGLCLAAAARRGRRARQNAGAQRRS